ncbi:hypothetical protein CBOM_04745 [Ceraceosorus bombacis]|uniref:Uncharacterized protein n=1 Tax=Ceraceosorus bombacis TaxID=401625 RepID=A0A0P1BPD4_9BASI|nr:hypothetical protein CBOM_04745 [Ceraceosorus bombacis]
MKRALEARSRSSRSERRSNLGATGSPVKLTDAASGSAGSSVPMSAWSVPSSPLVSDAPTGAVATAVRTAFGLIEQYPTRLPQSQASPSLLSPAGQTRSPYAFAGSPNMSNLLDLNFAAPDHERNKGVNSGMAVSSAARPNHHLSSTARGTKQRHAFDTADSPRLPPLAVFGSPRRTSVLASPQLGSQPVNEGKASSSRPSSARLSPMLGRHGSALRSQSTLSRGAQHESTSGHLQARSTQGAENARPCVSAAFVGLGIGIGRAFGSQSDLGLAKCQATDIYETAPPKRGFMVPADDQEDLSQLASASISTFTESGVADAKHDPTPSVNASTAHPTHETQVEAQQGLDNETIELGLLWQPLPSVDSLRGAKSFRLTGEPSTDGFAQEIPSDNKRDAVYDLADEDSDLAAISASSSERSFTTLADGALVSNRVLAALEAAGMSPCVEKANSLDLTTVAQENSVDAGDASGIVIFAGNRVPARLSDAQVSRHSASTTFSTAPGDISVNSAYGAAMKSVHARLLRASAVTRRRANTVVLPMTSTDPGNVRTGRARAHSQPKRRLATIDDPDFSMHTRASDASLRLGRFNHRTPPASVQKSAVALIQETPQSMYSMASYVSVMNGQRLWTASPEALQTPDPLRARTSSSSSREAAITSPAAFQGTPVDLAECSTPLASKIEPHLTKNTNLPNSSQLRSSSSQAEDALLAFFASDSQAHPAPASPLSDSASTPVATPTSDFQHRTLSIVSVASDIAPKAILVDTGAGPVRAPIHGANWDFHRPHRVVAAPERHALPSGPARAVSVSPTSSPTARIWERRSLSTPPRTVRPRTLSGPEAAEVLRDAITLLQSRERPLPPSNSNHTAVNSISLSTSDSGQSLEVKAQLLFQDVASATGKSCSTGPSIRSWSDEEDELSRMSAGPGPSPLAAHRLLAVQRKLTQHPRKTTRSRSGSSPTPVRTSAPSTEVKGKTYSNLRQRASTEGRSGRSKHREAQQSRSAPSAISRTALTTNGQETAAPFDDRPPPDHVTAASLAGYLKEVSSCPGSPQHTTARSALRRLHLQPSRIPRPIPRERLVTQAAPPPSNRYVHARNTSVPDLHALVHVSENVAGIGARRDPSRGQGSAVRVDFQNLQSRKRRATAEAGTHCKALKSSSIGPVSVRRGLVPLQLVTDNLSPNTGRSRARESDYASPTMQVFRFYDSRRSIIEQH